MKYFSLSLSLSLPNSVLLAYRGNSHQPEYFLFFLPCSTSIYSIRCTRTAAFTTVFISILFFDCIVMVFLMMTSMLMLQTNPATYCSHQHQNKVQKKKYGIVSLKTETVVWHQFHPFMYTLLPQFSIAQHSTWKYLLVLHKFSSDII